MATLEDLKNALRETLQARGVLGDLKAKIRSEIFAALDDSDAKKPRLTDENLMINELIREYLIHNNYHHTLSVLIAESGQPAQPALERAHIARELRVAEDYKSKSVPLLYGIVRGLKPVQSEQNRPEPSNSVMPRRDNLFAEEPEPFVFTRH